MLRLHSVVFAIAILLLAGTQLYAPAQEVSGSIDWRTLRPEGEEFSIDIPKDSTAEMGEQQYHKMVLRTRLYISKTKAGPIFAVASISGIRSNPEAYSEFQRLNSYVDAFKDWFPEKVRGKEAKLKLTLVGEKILNGHSGREYNLTLADLTGTAHVYATKKRFYAAVSLNTKKDEDLQDRFLSSFVIPEKVIEPPVAVAQQPASEAPKPAPATPDSKKPSTEAEKSEPNAEQAATESKAAETVDDKNAQSGQKKPISGGVLNGRALYLPKPDYPPEAHNAKASGSVVVQITIDELGAVIAAKAVSGHPLLQQACVNAALQARFSPTMLMGEPVKVSGVLTYNFAR